MAATKAHMRATAKYEKNAYDKIMIRVRKDSDINRDTITAAAEAAGQSVNAFILDAIKTKISI